MSDLHYVCKTGNIEEVRLLVDLGANIEAKTYYGSSSLHVACGSTPLYVASRNGRIDIVKLLVNLGADIEAKTGYGWTSLHSASCSGHIDIVKLLIYLDADVKAINNAGKTPAQVAKTTAIKIVIECYEEMTQLKEWSPSGSMESFQVSFRVS